MQLCATALDDEPGFALFFTDASNLTTQPSQEFFVPGQTVAEFGLFSDDIEPPVSKAVDRRLFLSAAIGKFVQLGLADRQIVLLTDQILLETFELDLYGRDLRIPSFDVPNNVVLFGDELPGALFKGANPILQMLDPLDRRLKFERCLDVLFARFLNLILLRLDLGTATMNPGFQFGDLRFERLALGIDVGERCGDAFLPGNQFFRARGKDRREDLAQAATDFAVTPRLSGLTLQGVPLPFDFSEDVVHPRQVASGGLEPRLGQFASRPKLGDPRGLFNQHAALGRLGGQELTDSSLFDDGVVVGTEPGTEEDVLNITQQARTTIEEILAFTRSVEAALDSEFDRSRWRTAVGMRRSVVDETDRHLGHPQRRPLAGAVEDDVLHLVAAERPHLLLTQNPRNGIGNVTLPHTRSDPPGQSHRR